MKLLFITVKLVISVFWSLFISLIKSFKKLKDFFNVEAFVIFKSSRELWYSLNTPNLVFVSVAIGISIPGKLYCLSSEPQCLKG